MGGGLVSQGWAVEHTQFSDGRYGSAEASARAAGVGVHAGPFTPPWEWRRQQGSTLSSGDAPSECAIKGNISRSGERIYHTPGMRSYESTRINEADGERGSAARPRPRQRGGGPCGDERCRHAARSST